jgi:DNA-directed RNA polymerase subunit M/transcription elongation factor TFIIS
MVGDLDQVGQTLICPDCGTPAVVPPPPKTTPKHAKPSVADETYPLLKEVSSSSEVAAPNEQNLIRVMCPRCNTMMYATKDQVGKRLICPDCKTSVVVPRAQPRRPAIDVMADAGEGYAVMTNWDNNTTGQGSQEEEKHAPQPSRDFRDPDTVAERADNTVKQSRSTRQENYSEPSFALFFVGSFSFPFTRDVIARTFTLATWACVLSLLMHVAFEGDSIQPSGGLYMAGPWVGRMLFATIGAVIFFAWLFVASAWGLTILRDTSYGSETVPEWPSLLALDGISETAYVLFGFLLSALPGILILGACRNVDVPEPLIVGISQAIFFPIFLLSMLETNSLFNPFSLSVWRSVLTAWSAWLVFYVLSSGMIAVALILPIVTASTVGFVANTAISAILSTTAWFIYFRLLGRLACYCIGQAQKAARHEAEE